MKRITITLMAAFWAVMSFAQVTPPTSATQETWWIESSFHYQENGQPVQESVSEEMKIARDGNDLYFDFPNPWGGNTWIKGTKDADGVYIFSKAQLVGNYGGNYYFNGRDAQGVADFSFYYIEAEKKFFSLDNIFITSSATDINTAIGYFDNINITESKPVQEELVVAPEGLQTQPYRFSGTSILYNNDGSVAGMESVSFDVKVGFATGNEVYIQGLCQNAPEAWVKGKLQEDEVTFAKGQYMGPHMYFCGTYFSELSDFVLTYNATTGAFNGGSYYMAISYYKEQLAPWAIYAGVTLNKVNDVAAKPSDPNILEYVPYNATEGYGTVTFSIPSTSTTGSPLITDKLSYQLYQDVAGIVTNYLFQKSFYKNLPEETMTEMPYYFADNYDFFNNGNGTIGLTLPESSLQFNRIGVQSIYRGGGEENRSEIAWYTISASGIKGVEAENNRKVANYNLQGQQVANDYKGIIIRNGKKYMNK